MAADDYDAFTEVYRHTRRRTTWVAQQTLPNPDDVAEVVQETYLYVWRRAVDYDPSRGTVPSWLSTLTRGKAIDRVRTTVAAAARDTRDANRTVTVVPGIDDLVADRLVARELHAALASLSARQREALTLTYFHGYSHTEAARALVVPLGTFKSRVRDGLVALRLAADIAASS